MVPCGCGPRHDRHDRTNASMSVQVADETVSEGAQRLVAEVAGGGPSVVEAVAARHL